MIRILAACGDWESVDPPKSTLEIPHYNREMLRTDRHFKFVSIGAIVVFVTMVWLSYVVAGDQCAEQLQAEQTAASIAFVCLTVSLVLQLLPLFTYKRSEHPPISGVIFAAIVVQLIALITNGIMAFGSAPVIIDPVTGARVSLLRWAEWTPLSFAMTFLVEGSNVPTPRWGLLPAYVTASTQGLSTVCGFLFPLCPGILSWTIAQIISFLLYFFILLRLYYRKARFQPLEEGKRLDELEIFNRSHLSLKLLTTCCIGWTFLVAMFVVFNMCCPWFAPAGSFLASPSLPMVSQTFTDVVLKVFYLSFIVSLHEQVFDEGARAKRRLEELRQRMWDSSSDVLAISVRSLSGIVTTMVSPTFFKMLREGKASKRNLQTEVLPAYDRGMLFELSQKDLESLLDDPTSTPQLVPKLYDFDFGGLNLQQIKKKVHVPFSHEITKLLGHKEMEALATLIARSWRCHKRDTLLSHELVLRNEDQILATIQCEAKVTRLEESALFVVVRDISERFRRFEAEKKAVEESTARRKDSEANRFTRHEVKNGLLAALGLSDSLAETMKVAAGPLEKLKEGVNDENAEDISKLCTVQDNVSSIVKELDSAIHEVLETILTEAMARDVIHELYVPKLEKVEMVPLLSSMSRHTKGNIERFPVTASPDPFPALLFDPQLLKCIHRNAISNACKYGKFGGLISTQLTYDVASNILKMDVTNEPGDNHEDIMKLGAEGATSVFTPGYRLHSKLGGGDKKSSIGRQSSGDGAWIMQQCAKTLGGECSIDFRENLTVFSLQCPAVSYETTAKRQADGTSAFKLPEGIWGVALDDSKMQRKLLKRFLLLAGVAEERIIVQGETAKEINEFDDYMFDFVCCHPNDQFLLIVDENLDIDMEDINMQHSCVSGSLVVQKLRYRLLPEQERQVFALIRSANDSAHDIAIYKSRAHGFIPKAPIKKDKIVSLLAPIWNDRYSVLDDDRSITASLHSADSWAYASEKSEEFSFVTEHIQRVDALVNQEERLADNWPEIWQKLHAFKGDLLSSQESQEAAVIVKAINDLRGLTLPIHFMERWLKLRALAVKLDEVGVAEDDGPPQIIEDMYI